MHGVHRAVVTHPDDQCIFRNTELLELIEYTADIMVVLCHLGAVVGSGGLVHEVRVRPIEVIAFACVIGEEGLLVLGVSLDEIDHVIGHISIHGVIEFQGERGDHFRLFAFFPLHDAAGVVRETLGPRRGHEC